MLLEMGVHPKVVQEILGHGEIGMTMNIYSHVMPINLLILSTNIELLLRLSILCCIIQAPYDVQKRCAE